VNGERGNTTLFEVPQCFVEPFVHMFKGIPNGEISQ
jgi:hypothetical protein